MRTYALYLVVVALSAYAWKDWFKSLCGLILLMAVIEHSDMPKSILGIQGLNPWNVLFASVVVAWAANRKREMAEWDMPRCAAGLLLVYLGVIVIGFLRAVLDRSRIEHYPLGDLISEELINTIKWVLPGLLLFDGCRVRRRVVMVLGCVLAMYVLISAQVIVKMPFELAIRGGTYLRAKQTKVCQDVGYSASDVSAMLAGACWGGMAVLPLMRRKSHKLVVFLVAGEAAFGQALTGGRAGYIAWLAIGLIFCLLKWRKQLLLVPVVILLLPIVLPAATARMLQGFNATDVSGERTIDDYSMTSGRTLIWPYVIDKIKESPWIGYGRRGMQRTGLAAQLMSEMRESFPHPHNMYLETLLDNGILGTLPILAFWGLMAFYSARLFRSHNHLYSAVGGLALALVLAQLIGGIGAQHVYPRESTLGMWIAIFLLLRVHVEEMRRQMMDTDALRDLWDEAMPRRQTAMVVSIQT